MLQRIHRPLRRLCAISTRRYFSEETPSLRGRVFVNAFPVRLGRWDLRHYLALLREKDVLDTLSSRLANIKSHSFAVVDVQPSHKDGGAFVTFAFTASDPEDALATIEAELKKEAKAHGGLPSWLDGGSGAWLVKGQPWIEDMSWRFPSPILNIAFDGPDVREERLYHLLRPYGAIDDIAQPVPVPAGTLRSAKVNFRSVRAATIAHSTIHGLEVSVPGSTSPTRLVITYTSPLEAHKVRDWMASHPRIVLPILVFLLSGLTYAIFDPVRSLMVQAKVQNWFDIREFKLYKWLQTKSMELRIFEPHPKTSSAEEVWKERKKAEADVRTYLEDWPSTIAFVHGPQGSGKTRFLEAVLKDNERRVLTIDCRALQNATSDTQLITVLARQVGYWPVFTFLNSAGHIIDLASVGLIGQKANLSSTLPDQVRDMLSVVRMGLKSVNASHQREVQREMRRQAQAEEGARLATVRLKKILRGTWHDGRLDCVAGNGVMCELGVGDELMDDDDAVAFTRPEGEERDGEKRRDKQDSKKNQKGKVEMEAVGSLPVVVIRNFAARGSDHEEIYDVLAEWAVSLVENQFAHVVVISDNRENFKRLAKALQSKPLQTIALYDADSASSLAFVKRKLKDADINLDYTREQVSYVERLGGRASDLESLIHKVSNGARVEEAVEDIIARGVSELRKNAFGDDADDAKNLPWAREQAWSLFKLLSKQAEAPYHEVLLEFPFKGDEAALRSMEYAELISIGTHNGRPSTIRPGKPVYKYVFERLVNDSIFQATQDIAFNEKMIAGAESIVKACEQELLTLKEIGTRGEHWWGGNSASSLRSRYLLSKMQASAMKIESLERKNTELKKVLAKGG
ncbi:RNA12 protein-domain-containing protein [Mycena maculata]|uniref:Mitochondrial escape protein 2 n=1 Tax=Mycena maculata TaxID=230809 RepID=A0AAD7NDW9_9AGAR|nr:RNA12 protein-domain-containing protein [Mycena maculata]